MKVTDITFPKVGKHIIVRPGKAGRRPVKGQVSWSEEGAWRLAGSRHTYRTANGDKITWMASSKPKVETPPPPPPLSLRQRVLRALKFWG